MELYYCKYCKATITMLREHLSLESNILTLVRTAMQRSLGKCSDTSHLQMATE